MDENENLKLEVQGLRSLMLQGVQLPGSSAIPTPALQVLHRRPYLPAQPVAVICNEGGVALIRACRGLAMRQGIPGTAGRAVATLMACLGHWECMRGQDS